MLPGERRVGVCWLGSGRGRGGGICGQDLRLITLMWSECSCIYIVLSMYIIFLYFLPFVYTNANLVLIYECRNMFFEENHSEFV